MRKLWYVVKESDPNWPLTLRVGENFTHDILEAKFYAWMFNQRTANEHYTVKEFTDQEDDE